MQVDVGTPVSVSAPHTCAVKAVLLAEATSTPLRVYPDAFEPVVKFCENALYSPHVRMPLPMLLTSASAGGVSASAGRVTITT